MSATKQLLAVWMGVPPESEEDLNRWYQEEHLGDRMSMPGFLAVRRYASLRGEPKYVALYDLADGALTSDAYQAARKNPTPWTQKVMGGLSANVRNEYEPIMQVGESPSGGAPYAFLVRLETDDEHDAELNNWYDKEHLAALAGVPGCYTAKRYRATSGSPKYLAVYELESPDVIESAAWRTAADTPWTLKMRPHFKNRADNLGQLIASVSA